ncbi:MULTISPECIES: CbtA family protein [unclassified Gordonia (in: high G+C Gram-positive bacteria)]|uniref:CbtA family protein n=1 Tax=unclassified Gordonia (in: high G+C Gram-positive bacteria) TaxID=2657482 RepID=UPI0009911398|nr:MULTISPECIES: CbtA family protein [unclassified Gordonia (in: high G+C Gram-positive bacteria)]MCX2752757.1 CbtA family protein [Gordonia sp. 4N]
MEKKFIGAGLLAGLIAGIVSFVFARFHLEPVVGKAIDYEGQRSEAEEALAHAAEPGGHSHGEGGEVVSRAMQENLGAGVGNLVFALCMGAFLAVAFTVLWSYLGKRYPFMDPRSVAGSLGAIGFVAVFGVPFFAYPANPPAVGDDDTIGERTGAFLTITVASVVLAIAAVVLALWLRPRIGGLVSSIAGTIAYLVAIAITIALLPSYSEVPEPVRNDAGQIVFPGFPGDVIGDFRVYAITNQVILWTVLTVTFALLLGALARSSTSTDNRSVGAAQG